MIVNVYCPYVYDESAVVKEFAQTHITELDVSIAAEHLRGEAEMELWKRNIERSDTPGGTDEGNP